MACPRSRRDPNAKEAEEGGSKVQGQLGLHSKTRPPPKKKRSPDLQAVQFQSPMTRETGSQGSCTTASSWS
jgi:hypothetical protein